MDELCSDEKRVETGYMDGRRYVPSLCEQSPAASAPFIRRKDTVLVTGGALGITYEILKKTAETFQTDFIILGRSRISDLDPSLLNPDVTPQIIMDRVKANMPGARPLDIKKAADRLMRSREAALNILRLKESGVNVHYESVDVTDSKSVERAVGRHRTIDGILHAAGVEESQFIEKKDPASFNRVCDVKITGLNNVLRAMKNRNYRYAVTFSSVTARFGNEGQADYTAANDMIGKILMREKQNHPSRQYKVYSWTAWSGTGMAENDTVRTVLASRGVTFLPIRDGRGKPAACGSVPSS
jgi:NAD(P)-dependent dehydrogenase (short-subunit alcohol dehydrogenase family)